MKAGTVKIDEDVGCFHEEELKVKVVYPKLPVIELWDEAINRGGLPQQEVENVQK